MTWTPVIPVFHLQPMSTYLALSVSRQRFALGLVAALGTLALGLAAIGVFGVMSFLVRSRSRELGVRMAVGASPADIRRLVSGQLLRCLAGGVVIGLGVAAVEARTLAALVFGIGVFDLSTIAIVTAVLVATVALSAAVPVHRSTRIDPVITLRTD